MKNKKESKFPAYKILERDPDVVPCEISSRYLKFSKEYYNLKKGKLVFVDVMTVNDKGEHYKLCEMSVSLEDLEKIIGSRTERQ